jgi:hypothetical protein
VRAEPGVTLGEFDRETQAFGLATTGGFVPSTGIAGLTLGGGLGYLMRRFGLTCDNLLSADLVTADGQLRKVSATENEDLFWAIRGGRGNFGASPPSSTDSIQSGRPSSGGSSCIRCRRSKMSCGSTANSRRPHRTS